MNPIKSLTLIVLAGGILVGTLHLSGCDLVMSKTVVEKVGEKAPAVGDAAGSLLDTAESVTGRDLVDEQTADTGLAVTDTVNRATDTAGRVVGAVAPFVPEKHRPWADLAKGVLGAISALSLALAGVFRGQKAKAEAERDAVAKAAVIAADNVSRGGAALTSAATATGAKDLVKRTYADAVAAGDVSTGRSATSG